MSLVFEPTSHTYTFDDKPVPGVTDTLSLLSGYMNVPDWRLAMAADRGTEVHRMCELFDLGQLGDFDDKYAPYLDAWIAFLLETGFEVELCERFLYHPKLGYAGQLDRTGYLKKKRGLIDIKTTAQLMPVVGPQTAAYEELEKADGNKVDFRWAVQLKPDGRYQIHKLDNRRDFATFTSCLNIMRWRQEHGYV